jgi:hypothetical protein
VPDDTNAMPDLFVHDRVTGRTECVTRDSMNAPWVAQPFPGMVSYGFVFSPSGRFVVFGDAFGAPEINRFDLGPADNLGFALPGGSGIQPFARVVQGGLGQPWHISLLRSRAQTFAVLGVGTTASMTPYLGGTLVPWPPAFLLPLTTRTDGGASIPFFWSGGLPSGTPVYAQWGIGDPTTATGLALSNAVSVRTP